MAKPERVQVTAYLTDSEHIDAWAKIKSHHGKGVSDSTIVRNLIQYYASKLDEGLVLPLSPEELSEKVIALESRLAEIERMLATK